MAVVTAHPSVDYAVRALRNKADEFLEKPVRPDKLVETVSALVAKGRAAREAARQSVLAIGAHPDDVEIGAAGTLAMHRRMGHEVAILTLSRGARGGTEDTRASESRKAAEVIGATLYHEDLQDTSIREGDPTISVISRIVETVRPTVIYTHSLHDVHQDHRNTHLAALVAVRQVGRVYCFQSPSATVDFRPTRFVAIDEQLDRKLQAIDAFASQVEIRAYLEPDLIASTARYWSRYCEGRYAEPFEVVREAAVAGQHELTPAKGVVRGENNAGAAAPDRRRRPRPDDQVPNLASEPVPEQTANLQGRTYREGQMPRHDISQQQIRVLVTGAGGPAAVSVIKSLKLDPTVQLLAADMDAWAARLYLLPPDARTLIPAGLDPDFASAVLARCAALGVNVLIPTVDAEMRPLAGARAEYGAAGIELMLAPARALDLTLDKLALAQCCAGHVRVPRTECFDEELDPASWDYPVVLKPRTGSGSRDISVVTSAGELAALERSAEFIVQEYLPGEEYSIDVLADTRSHVIASVPRVRTRVDSGVSVAGRTVHDPELEHFGATVASVTGLTYIANVQARRDVAGRPALLEVNPRAPGALPLTMASGVDMPRLALDALRGLPVPEHMDFREVAMVRFLEERFMDLSEVQKVAA